MHQIRAERREGSNSRGPGKSAWGLGAGGLDEEVEAVVVAEASGGFEEVVGDVGWVEDFVGGGGGRGLGGEGDGVGVEC